MLPYHGTLSEAHHREVVRLALRSHGLAVDPERCAHALAAQWREGLRLRDEVFPRLVGAFADPAVFLDVERTEPYLWSRLPWITAAGYLQARELHATGARDDGSEDAAHLAAAFHAAIVVLDFLVDERQLGQRVFERIDAPTLAAIFVDPESGREALVRGHRREEDGNVRLVLGLVGACATLGRRLLERSGNTAAWTELMQLAGHMHGAQRSVTASFYPSRDQARALLPALEAKSVLPAAAIAAIASLVDGVEGVPAAWRERARLLGRVAWLADDLIDLLSDSLRGVPSVVLLRLADLAAAHGREWATDGDIYEIVDTTAHEIVGLLDDGEPLAADAVALRLAVWAGWEEPGYTARGRRDARGGPVDAAARFVLEQQTEGHSEAIHWMTFPRVHEGICRMETHAALLFQRAVVLDALLDAATATQVPDRVVAAEALAILRAKHRAVSGGWNYIPEVEELAPDADDLAAVLEALRRVGGRVLAETCEEGIELALEAREPDGSFPTWILDPLGRSPGDDAIREYLWIGGRGIHPEVVANLLFALDGYDRERFAEAVDRAVTYFEAVQEADGTWSSRWYAGPLYGTYKVLAALRRSRRSTPAVARAVDAVLALQHDDGGWGDALSTALAMLALVEAEVPARHAALLAGTSRLAALQQDDGGWPACLWGFFETGVGDESYGSRTITTAYCLKALLAAAPAPDESSSTLAVGASVP